MSESTLKLASIYKGWDHHHHQLLEAVRPLSVDQLAKRAAPQVRSIRELVAHMIAVRARCFYYVFQQDKAPLADLVTWDQGDAPERSTLLPPGWLRPDLAGSSRWPGALASC